MRTIILGLLALLLAAPAYAQLSLPGAESALFFSLDPRNPAPGETVRLSLQSVLYDLDASDIVWSEDKDVIAEGGGLKSITLQVGGLGSVRTIGATISGPSGSASAEITIAPATLDLLWEADSYTPPFYKGRALPAAGGVVRIAAIPHFIRANGSTIPPSDIVFSWKRDGQFLESISGRGKASAVLEGPTLFGAVAITVDAVSADGTLEAQTIVRLADTRSRIEFYENHPLFGILFGQAIGTSAFIPDSEMTFTAIPYFAPANSASDQALEYDWTVNEQAVIADRANANELTINAASSSGRALIELSLTHRTNFSFTAKNAWQVTLNSRGGGGGDPFRL